MPLPAGRTLLPRVERLSHSRTFLRITGRRARIDHDATCPIPPGSGSAYRDSARLRTPWADLSRAAKAGDGDEPERRGCGAGGYSSPGRVRLGRQTERHT